LHLLCSNLPEQLTVGTTTVNYWYNADGQRIRKQADDVDEIYVYGVDGQTEAVFDATGGLKFFNISTGTENIGRLEAAAYELRLSNVTLSGVYTGNNIIVENNVNLTGTARLKAGISVTLKPGFRAAQGCSLIVSIDTTLVVEPEKYYYVKDHLGSTRVTVDEEGEIASYYGYDPWGMVLDGRSGNFGIANEKYKFTGKERDDETNYDYFGARYYDARIGRWLQVDPKMDIYPKINPFNYVLNNPLTTIDPDGRDTLYFDQNGNYAGKYSKGGENIGHIQDKEGNFISSFSFLDPSDAASIISTRDENGNMTGEKTWIKNGDEFVITGLNLNIENSVDAIVNLSIANAKGMSFGGRLGFIAGESMPEGSMDFTYFKNPLGVMLKTNELAVIGKMSYNRFDAGNYFWGAAMRELGFSSGMAQLAARTYERIKNNRSDQNYDQIAIWNGALRVKK
jgi:RHS repeat-associated protein